MGPLSRFESSRSSLSRSNSMLCASLALHVYGDELPGRSFEREFRRFVCAMLGGEEPERLEFSTDALIEFAAIELPQALIVVLRGTDDDRGEWFSTFGNFPSLMQAAPRSWGRGVAVHRGLLRTLNRAY